MYEDNIVDADDWVNDDPIVDDNFPEIREASERPKRNKSSRKAAPGKPQETVPKLNSSDESYNRCYNALCKLREQIAAEEGCGVSEVIDREVLEMLSLTPPTGECQTI